LNQDAEGVFLEEQPGIKTDTFRLLRTQFGWRIDATINHQHILPAAALGLPRIHPESRARISALMNQNSR
jgi:hypothetical protein